MLSHAPSRLHHSRTPSVDCRPIMPISTMIVSEKANSTSGGAHTKACDNPATSVGVGCHWCSSSMIAQSRACSTPTQTNGASRAAPMAFQSVKLCTEQNDRSHSEQNSTDNGNGQYFHASVRNPPYVLSAASSPPAVVSPQR